LGVVIGSDYLDGDSDWLSICICYVLQIRMMTIAVHDLNLLIIHQNKNIVKTKHLEEAANKTTADILKKRPAP
jgi:hypothetical protein